MPSVMSKDGTKIAYDKRGDGPVVILVLGSLNKRGSGKKLAQALSDRFTVVAYDRRGRGGSGDTKPYTVEKEIDDLEALVDQLGGSASLYGHSSGAVLAILTAQRLGPKIRALAVYEVPYNRNPEAQQASTVYRDNLTKLLAADERDAAVASFVKSVGVTDKQVAAMKRIPLWKSLTDMAPTLAYDTIELVERYPVIDLRDVGAPTLVMYGAASPAFMAETAEEIASAVPGAKLQSLEDQTHDVKPEVLGPVLADFFGSAALTANPDDQ